MSGAMSDRAKPAPAEGGPLDAFLIERASNTPLAARKLRRTRARAAAGGGTPVAGPLRGLQEWFAQVITDPRSVEHGVAAAARRPVARGVQLERLVTRGPQLSAADRLRIYHYAYHARLSECLGDDFPALRSAIGADAFTRLCRGYIQAHPSTRPNLNGYSAGFAAYLRDEAPRLPRRGFAADLARLEWALVDVLHARAAPTFDVAALQAIGLERWAGMRLRPSATVILLEFAHPVNAWFQAWREDRAGAVPRRGWSATAVYRQGYRVWRMDLTPPMHAILARLFAGRTLGQALGAAAKEHGDPQRLVADLQIWFREWVAGGFFAAIAQ
jgi:hypothetical protein